LTNGALEVMRLKNSAQSRRYAIIYVARIIDKLHELHIDPDPPEEWISLSVDREVLKES
jgi:hypothetical protein